ncbi:MAG TPA: FecR domain-containing protein [Spirochaetota bacterium]|nr:FecR domain-containing protein [Spirochaetota bacterium]
MDEKTLKFFSGELSTSERSEFLQEVDKDEFKRKDFIGYQNIYSVSQLASRNQDKTEGKKSLEKFILPWSRSYHRDKWRTFIQYAAVIVAVISFTVPATLYLSDRLSGESLNTLYVPPGQRAHLTLQDGTEVWLNAQSTLKYPSKFSKKQRRVEVAGEAFFDVAENSKRPFVVSANHVNLEVLGTQFNIYSYGELNFAEATLVEGSLKVTDNRNENNSVILRPNEQLSFENGEFSVSPISNAEHLLWREGIYCFDDEKLIDIIDKLELYYDVEIIVEDPEIFNFNYTGKFRQRDGIDEILRLLQIIQPFKIKKDRDNNQITLYAYEN